MGVTGRIVVANISCIVRYRMVSICAYSGLGYRGYVRVVSMIFINGDLFFFFFEANV